MQIISAYMLLVACFLALLFWKIESAQSVTNKFFLLAALIFIPAILMGFCELQGTLRYMFFLLLAASMPVAEFTARAVRRRRSTIPPRIRVKGSNYNATACITAMLLLIVIQSVIIAVVIEDRWTHGIWLILIMALFPADFIVTRSARSEICGNGIWLSGDLFTWDKFDCFTWTMKDKKAVVEFGIGGRKPSEIYRPLRLTVPSQNVGVAKQLLEENLPNLSVTPEMVKA